MTKKLLKPCKHPGCSLLTEGDYCEFHARLHKEDNNNSSNRKHDSK